MNQSKPLGDKVRSSLVLKINLRMVRNLVGAFLLFDIILISILLSLSIWQLQAQSRTLFETYTVAELMEDPRPAAVIGFTERVPRRNQGNTWAMDTSLLNLSESIQRHSREQFYYPADSNEQNWLTRLQGFSYEVVLNQDGQSLILSYSLAPAIKLISIIMISVIVMQVIHVSVRSGQNTKAVRKILAPLSALAEATWTLQEISSGEAALSEDELNALALELRGIDAASLDTRLELSSDQNELKSLTEAINGLLERIRLSYQSQVRFVSDASHELRTPIAVIQGYINLLDRWGKTNSDVRDEAITAIKSETESMKQLIEQLLFLARGENHSLKLTPERFDMADLAEDIVREAKLVDETHEYRLKVFESADVYADKQFIKQAIRVLIENAEKFSPDGELISIRVRAWDQKVAIEVQDNGIGIAAADVPHIFDRFYRSDESRARSTGGSGLGLAIAQWIATQHKGYYEVISQQDIGTRISLVIPQADAGSESTVSQPE